MAQERILILFGADSLLGWGRSCRLANAFFKNGHKVAHIEIPKRIWATSRKTRTADGIAWESLRGLPACKINLLGSINQAFINRQIDDILERLSFSPTILWVYNPVSPGILKRLRARYPLAKAAYDCADERINMALVERGAKAAKKLEAAERETIKLCDLVFCVSKALAELKANQAGAKNVLISTNGVDDEFCYPADTPIPHELATCTGRKFGYVGSLQHWLDIDLIKRCAERYRNCQFFFVGPVQTDVSILEQLPNVSILGSRPYSEVASYISAADVLFNPIRDVHNWRYCNSMKILQYVAMGKPVVAMDFAGSDDYFGLVRQTSDPEEFLRMLGETPESPAEREERRAEFARLYSWTEIARSALDRLPELGAAV